MYNFINNCVKLAIQNKCNVYFNNVAKTILRNMEKAYNLDSRKRDDETSPKID